MFGILKVLMLIVVMTGVYVFSTPAQTDEMTEVKIQQQIGSRYFSCFLPENKVYDAESLKKLAADEKCSAVNLLKVDFTKQSLIGYQVGGDCFISADAKVFRNQTAKTYKVQIFNYWGGCRAGGSFSGWLVIDKIPDDYKVEFNEIKVDTIRGDIGSFNLENLMSGKSDTQVLETREIDLKGCIQTHFTKQFVITDETTYLKTIRNDASRDFCLKNLEKIDFEKNSLLGFEINSGYCRRPVGLEFQVMRNDTDKKYEFNIGYTDPKGSVCRALSQYDLWVLVPKIPDGFEVKFDVQGK